MSKRRNDSSQQRGQTEPVRFSRGRLLAGGAVIVAAVLISYTPAYRAGFVWDDDHYVRDNLTLRTAAGLWTIWLEPGATVQYYPLTFTTFWIEFHLWGLNPAGYHTLNIVLHAVNVLLVWWTFRRLSVPGAWLAAALFALHPVHVESVAWITERKNVLSAAFYLLSALSYFHYRPFERQQTPARGGRLLYALALAAFMLALLCKTAVCSLPAALLLVYWWKRKRLLWSDVRPLSVFFAVGIAMSIVTIWVEHHGGARGEEWAFSLADRALIAGRAAWFYFAKLLWPVNLAYVYPRWELVSQTAWQYLYPLSAAAVIVALWASRKRIGYAPSAAALFFVGTHLPTLGFVNFYYMRYSFVADHFQYLPSLGIIALAAGGATLSARRMGRNYARGGSAAAALVLAVFAGLVWRQTLIYKDLETILRDTLARNPACWMALNNLGNHYSVSGRIAEAIELYKSSLQVRPGHYNALNNLAYAYTRIGEHAQAIEIYTRAVRRYPRDKFMQYELGAALRRVDRTAEARRAFAEAVRLDPQFVEARVNLATVLVEQGDAGAAVEELREAVRLRPGFVKARVALAELLAAMRRSNEAVDQLWLLAADADPQVRNGAEALALAQRLLATDGLPRVQVLDILAAAQAELAEFAGAIETARQALDLAREANAMKLAEQIEQRLRLYRAGRPYRRSRDTDNLSGLQP